MELKSSTSIKILKMNQCQELIAYEGRPTAEVEAILNQVVAKGTQGNYINHNMDLILWIYDKEDWREELLKDWMVERLNEVEDKGRKEMRAICKEALKAINRSDDNCPIVLEKMTFNIFSHYTSTKKSKKSGGHLSATGYGGIRSALTHLFRMSGKNMDAEFKKRSFSIHVRYEAACCSQKEGVRRELR